MNLAKDAQQTLLFRTRKIERVFDMFDLDNDGIICMADCMVFPNNLLEDGKLVDGTRLRKLYKEHYVRACQAAGYPAEQVSMRKDDWVRGVVNILETDWYRMEFVPGVVDIYFAALDVNQDGKIGFSEWEHFYKTRGINDEEFLIRTFRQMDTNGDGVISPEEFKLAFTILATGDDPNQDFSFMYARREK